jgi:cyclomaltodextrinase / maltogenic alpha-amylase / neopullulanase
MNDFIFGSLATDELRRARVQGRRAGVSHGFQRIPRDPVPDQAITFTLQAGPAHPGDRAWIYWTVDGSDPRGSGGLAEQGHADRMEAAACEWDTELWGYIRHFQITLPGFPAGTLLRYRLSLHESDEKETFADNGAFFALWIDDDPLPDWTRDAIVYQIFPDRYNPGEGRDWLMPETPAGFYGGRLAGITEKLDEIAALEFNTLWLCPVFPSPSHHGYDMSDLFDVEPRLGTKEDLRKLLDGAHQRGMRVLLDFVPNHWSNQHAIFMDAISDAHSHYKDWFTFTQWPEEYETFFGVKELPQVNLRNPDARQYMLKAAKYWLDFGADGYRVDYAIGPTLDFWADFRRVCRAAKPDCWIFGEIVDPPDVQIGFDGLLDGSLDFMLLEGLRQALAFSQWDGIRLANFLERHEAFFGPNFSRPSFLDNHDMNRFLWAAEGDERRLRLAALVQFTLMGPPVVYYGTEVGLSQERDVRQGTRGLPEESRLPMLWGREQNLTLRRFYYALIHFRRSSNALRRGKRVTVLAEPACLAYAREIENERLVVVINLTTEPQLVAMPEGCSRRMLGTDPQIEMIENRIYLPPLAGGIWA